VHCYCFANAFSTSKFAFLPFCIQLPINSYIFRFNCYHNHSHQYLRQSADTLLLKFTGIKLKMKLKVSFFMSVCSLFASCRFLFPPCWYPFVACLLNVCSLFAPYFLSVCSLLMSVFSLFDPCCCLFVTCWYLFVPCFLPVDVCQGETCGSQSVMIYITVVLCCCCCC